MLLAIDIGNTNIEFGVFDGGALTAKFRLGTNREMTSDEPGLLLLQFFSANGIDKGAIEDVILMSVVPQVNYSIAHMSRKYLHINPLIVGESIQIPIENRYGNPAEVGADRLAGAYAAKMRYGYPAVVVDFGTATTFDVIDGDGAYAGGAIFPGIKISMDALFQKAAKLPRVEIADPGTVIGKSTAQSMQAGVYHGYVGSVRNILTEINKAVPGVRAVVATGGLSTFIGREGGLFSAIDRTLTLDALQMIYAHHKNNP